MKITSITKAINRELKTIEGVNIIADEIRSGFEDLKPAFFVQMTLISSDEFLKIITANIHYFSKEKTQVDLLKMTDRLNDIFAIFTLKIDEENILKINNIRADFIDNVLQYRFDIFVENKVNTFDEKDSELMKYLEMEGV